MKKSLCVIIILTTLILLSGCVKNEFSVRFEFPKDYVGNYMVDYYAWNSKKGAWLEAVAPLQNGVADVLGSTNRPTIAYIRDASSSNSIAVYVERGDKIVISGDNPDMNTWNIKGNKISERWSQWRNKNAKVLSGSRDKQTKEKEKAIADFVNSNKNDKLSALILLTEWSRRENTPGFLKLWNAIDEDARSHELLEMFGSTDLMGVEFETDADGNLNSVKKKKQQRIVVRSNGNGVDTLGFNKVKSSFLYFFEDNNSAREEVIDSLKVLVKAYPDSAKRIISDICLRPDSMTWINSTRRDSLSGVIRAWLPAGLTDKEVAGMGVARYPWFVVVRKDGSDAYSGSDLKDAVAAFRKEMDKKTTSKKSANSTPKKSNPNSTPKP